MTLAGKRSVTHLELMRPVVTPHRQRNKHLKPTVRAGRQSQHTERRTKENPHKREVPASLDQMQPLQEMSAEHTELGLNEKCFRFEMSFLEPTLGIRLEDDDGTRITGFSRIGSGPLLSRTPGPAESSGRVQIGDRVVRVNDSSCIGLDFAQVGILLRDAARPIRIIFE